MTKPNVVIATIAMLGLGVCVSQSLAYDPSGPIDLSINGDEVTLTQRGSNAKADTTSEILVLIGRNEDRRKARGKVVYGGYPPEHFELKTGYPSVAVPVLVKSFDRNFITVTNLSFLNTEMSIHLNGRTCDGKPFKENDPPLELGGGEIGANCTPLNTTRQLSFKVPNKNLITLIIYGVANSDNAPYLLGLNCINARGTDSCAFLKEAGYKVEKGNHAQLPVERMADVTVINTSLGADKKVRVQLY
jgi:hypothetical protein